MCGRVGGEPSNESHSILGITECCYVRCLHILLRSLFNWSAMLWMRRADGSRYNPHNTHLPVDTLLKSQSHHPLDHMIRYRLQSKLGPVKIPTQNIKLPSTFRSLIHLILASSTSGSCSICIPIRYPRSFLKIHHMTSSWIHADRRKVTSVAVGRESLKALIEE